MQNQKFLTQNNLILAIIAIGVCLLSFAGPGALTVHAFTVEELNIQIKTLQQQIAALQNQLNELQKKNVTNVPEKESEEVVITQTVYTLTQNLRYGDGGLDVRDFQTCLKSDPIVYPEGLVTGYFGSLTKADVIRFQEKYVDEILKPLGLSKGTGFVGESTIAKLNAVCGVSSKSESTVPEAKVELEPEMKLKTDPEPKSEVDDTAPIILDITVSDLTVTSATMSWKTNEITKPVLYFGISTSNMTQYPFNVWVDSYQVRKSNLEPETTYYFKIEVQDKAGNKTVAERKEFKTLDTPKPMEILKPVIPEFKPITVPNICVSCLGTDTSCGCLNCVDCNKSDGWVNAGQSYSSDLGPGGFYMNQDQGYRDYFCSGSFCEYKVTRTQTKRTWIKDSSSPLYPGMGLPKDFGKINPF